MSKQRDSLPCVAPPLHLNPLSLDLHREGGVRILDVFVEPDGLKLVADGMTNQRHRSHDQVIQCTHDDPGYH